MSHEFVRFIEESVSLAKTDLDLSLCPGFSGDLFNELSPSLLPICAAMRHNLHFRGMALKKPAAPHLKKDLVLHFSSLVRCNTTLTTISLHAIGGSSTHWEQFGQNLAQNPHHVIHTLDLSHNKLEGRGFISLLNALSAFPHSLRSLRLVNCGLSAKSIAGLLNVFERHLALFMGLEELDLSGNLSFLDELNVQAFERLLNAVRGQARLSLLLATNSRLSFAAHTPPFFNGLATLSYLRTLDLSHNGDNLDVAAAQRLAAFFEASRALQVVNLAHCKMKPQSIDILLRGLFQNQFLTGVELDISAIGLSNKIVDLLLPHFRNSLRLLRLLNLSRNKLGEDSLAALLRSLLPRAGSSPSILTTLLLDECLAASPRYPRALADCFHELLVGLPGLRSLSIAGSYGKVVPYFLRKTLPIESLQLIELNISHNKLNDAGASLLAAALCQNRSLLYLNADANNFSLNGFQALLHCFSFPGADSTNLRNDTLLIFKWPWEDYFKAYGDLNAAQQHQLQTVLEDIQKAVHLPLITDARQLTPFVLAQLDREPLILEAIAAASLNNTSRASCELPSPLPPLTPEQEKHQLTTPVALVFQSTTERSSMVESPAEPATDLDIQPPAEAAPEPPVASENPV
jgi:Ran GTPase-activating protein (RanGAP) involved in mRNA processing and transport